MLRKERSVVNPFPRQETGLHAKEQPCGSPQSFHNAPHHSGALPQLAPNPHMFTAPTSISVADNAFDTCGAGIVFDGC